MNVRRQAKSAWRKATKKKITCVRRRKWGKNECKCISLSFRAAAASHFKNAFSPFFTSTAKSHRTSPKAASGRVCKPLDLLRICKTLSPCGANAIHHTPWRHDRCVCLANAPQNEKRRQCEFVSSLYQAVWLSDGKISFTNMLWVLLLIVSQSNTSILQLDYLVIFLAWLMLLRKSLILIVFIDFSSSTLII